MLFVNVLFWNLKRNNLASYIISCLTEYDIDIAIFSEHLETNFLSIQNDTAYTYIPGMGGCEKIALLVKSNIIANVKQEQSRYALYHIQSGISSYIIAGVHLHDRRNTDTATRIACIGRLVNDIKNVENRCKCSNTIIIGDFNANPYDEELLQMNAFNAVLFKEIIKKSETKTIDGVTYRRFYNPTVNFISENNKNYGSFYYTGGSSSPIWHCLDQVLVSKSLVDNIRNLVYLKTIAGTTLLKNIQPNEAISDHLPLFVEFN